jgi:hypothetical protein
MLVGRTLVGNRVTPYTHSCIARAGVAHAIPAFTSLCPVVYLSSYLFRFASNLHHCESCMIVSSQKWWRAKEESLKVTELKMTASQSKNEVEIPAYLVDESEWIFNPSIIWIGVYTNTNMKREVVLKGFQKYWETNWYKLQKLIFDIE